MACLPPTRMQLAPSTSFTVTATPSFEMGMRPQCSRTRSSRGRPQQCARAAARTSSSRYGSRGSSAGSRSSARSRRPSSEIEFRDEVQSTVDLCLASSVDPPAVTQRAIGVVSSAISYAIDDIATEVDYFSDDDCPCSPFSPMSMLRVSDAELVLDVGEPAIVEDVDENEEAGFDFTQALREKDSNGTTLVSDQSDGEESSGCDVCDFDDDVCSMASSDLDRVEHVDEMLMATEFARRAVSDAVIVDAFEVEAPLPDADEEHLEEVEFVGDASPSVHELAFDFASGFLDGAFSQIQAVCADTHEEGQNEEEEDDVEFLGEAPPSGHEMAFDLASSILGGAFTQAATSWSQVESTAKSVKDQQEAQDQAALEGLKTKAREGLTEAARNGFKMTAQIELLKEKARASLLRAAQAKEAPQIADMKPAPTSCSVANEQMDTEEKLRQQVKQTLTQASASGKLELALKQALQAPVSKAAADEDTQGAVDSKLDSVIQNFAAPSPSEATMEAVALAAQKPQSSRSRRRVIGGIVRGPSAQELPSPAAWPMNSAGSKRDSKSRRPPALTIDFGVESGEECSAPARASSITRSYDTLGAQFFSLAADEEEQSTAAAESPASGTPSRVSKARTRLQEASASAMAMDLMEDAPRTSSSSRPLQRSSSSGIIPSSAWHMNFKPMQLSSGKTMRSSVSTGSLSSKKTKAGSGGFLPALVSEKPTAGSIAWTMQMSRPSSRWSDMGLRNSASMVF